MMWGRKPNGMRRVGIDRPAPVVHLQIEEMPLRKACAPGGGVSEEGWVEVGSLGECGTVTWVRYGHMVAWDEQVGRVGRGTRELSWAGRECSYEGIDKLVRVGQGRDETAASPEADAHPLGFLQRLPGRGCPLTALRAVAVAAWKQCPLTEPSTVPAAAWKQCPFTEPKTANG
eukprot:364299-Chlamydomonas_euryale.AAC.3